MVSNHADNGTIVLEIIKCEANLVSDVFVIFKLDYLHKIPAAWSLYSTVLSHI